MTPTPTPTGAGSPPAAAEPPVGLPRLLAGVAGGGPPMDLLAHLSRHGPLPARGRRGPALIEVLERSGLCGRGGAAFPTFRKLAGVAARRGPAVVVGNGTEGEPASAKDRRLLTAVPHLVLDGAALAARAVGAPDAILAVHPAAAPAVAAAVAEREARRMDRVRFRVAVPPERFVTGEASALVHWINSGVATPTMRPPHVSERGVDHRPTLVDNVETLAHIALIARHGADWFRTLGTPGDPGSSLVTISGPVGRPGVYEISRGMTVREVLQAARGATEPLQALLLGGYFGTWLPSGEAMELRLCAEGLRPAGASLGAGVLMALGVGSCGLVATARLASYLADQTAGQCGPCVHGLAAIAGELDRLARRAGRVDLERLSRWGREVEGRGACHHPDGAVGMVRSGLRTFAEEVRLHQAGACSAASDAPVATGAGAAAGA